MLAVRGDFFRYWLQFFPMRPVVSVTLVLLLLYQSMGYLLIYEGKLSAWRHAQWEIVEEELESDRYRASLSSIEVEDLADLDWEDKREFRWQGQMYDLVSAAPEGSGGWQVLAIADDVETRMRADFEALLAGHNPDGSRVPPSSWSRLLTQVYLQLQPPTPLAAAPLAPLRIHEPDWHILPAPYLGLWSPPPLAC